MKQLTSLVSVIIPVYNGEKFITSCYEQLLAIDYPELEFVFIDNNSDDDSLLLLKSLADTDPRIQIYSETKKGAGAARNTGIYQAKGEIISFLDVDDQVSPDKIKRHVEILQKYPSVGMVFGSMYKYYADKNAGYYIPKTNELKAGFYEPPFLGLHWLSHFGRLPGTCAITALKKKLIEQRGFQSDLLRGEDAALWIKIGMNYPIYFLNEYTSTYVRHSLSTTTIDNSNSQGDPYYIQFKRFYLPYFAFENINREALKVVNRKILSSLINHVTLGKTRDVLSKRQGISIELKELIDIGFSPKYVFLAKLTPFLGVRLSRIIYKASIKLNLL
jgi:glycosyltransferase involved in cell wall biosynthesis